jgi:hypothetical protein
MNFYEIVSQVLTEGYLKLTPQADEFIRKVFVPKLKETTLNYKNILVFDVLKAAKTGSYDEVRLTNLKGRLSFDFIYKMKYSDSRIELDVSICYTNLRTTARAEFSRLDKEIVINVPCVSIIDNNALISQLKPNFESKTFDKNSLIELEKEFKESLKDIDKGYLNHMLKGATFKTTLNSIEHEFIHAIDPASHQSKDDSKESLEKYGDKYAEEYYGTPERNAGKMPAEFNPFFWNIIRSFETPLNSKTRQFLISFIQNPQPLINKLKLFDVETLNIGQLSSYVLGLFKGKDKDYMTFIRILNERNHRKLLIRIFEDPYLKKKFLQKLYTFVENS